MDEKDFSEFQGELEVGGEETKNDKKQQDPPTKKVNYSKSGRRSGSFVRNWGGWLIGDE